MSKYSIHFLLFMLKTKVLRMISRLLHTLSFSQLPLQSHQLPFACLLSPSHTKNPHPLPPPRVSSFFSLTAEFFHNRANSSLNCFLRLLCQWDLINLINIIFLINLLKNYNLSVGLFPLYFSPKCWRSAVLIFDCLLYLPLKYKLQDVKRFVSSPLQP